MTEEALTITTSVSIYSLLGVGRDGDDGGGSEESTGVCSRVLLVPVAVRQPHSQHLGEAEEQPDASSDPQDLSCVQLDLIRTWLARVVRETGSCTGGVVVHVSEATAVQALLHVPLSALGVVPAHLQQMILLLPVDGQTRTGDGELYYEHQEEDDHVKEEQDLVVLHGPDESGQRHEEEEDPHSDQARHHLETGHQPQPLPPGRDAHQQQAHHHVKDVERAQAVFGAGESSAAHVVRQEKDEKQSNR